MCTILTRHIKLSIYFGNILRNKKKETSFKKSTQKNEEKILISRGDILKNTNTSHAHRLNISELNSEID